MRLSQYQYWPIANSKIYYVDFFDGRFPAFIIGLASEK